MLLVTAVMAFAQVSHSFTSQVADFQILSEGIYKVVTGQQTRNFTTQEGAPQLPVFTRSFVLPAGSTVTNIAVSNQSEVLMSSNILLYPVQPPEEWDSIPPFVPPTSAIYNSSAPFPQETVVKISDVSSLGYHIVTLDICPFKYIPNEKKLYLYRNVEISIQYTVGDIEQTEKITHFREELSKEMVASSVANPELLASMGATAKAVLNETNETGKLVMHCRPMGNVPDYLIITSEELKPIFQELADYKIKRGIPTLIVTVEDIYGRYPGVDNAEKVRNYLKDAHHEWGSSLFVLLGGDTAIIPGRIGSYQYEAKDGVSPTDLYYSDVYQEGNPGYNWNQNGNARFG